MTFSKKHNFEPQSQSLADFARLMSHPARIEILNYLSLQCNCISGDISNEIPLNRTTVSQHLKELKDAGYIKGTVDGKNIYYCLDYEKLTPLLADLKEFISMLEKGNSSHCK